MTKSPWLREWVQEELFDLEQDSKNLIRFIVGAVLFVLMVMACCIVIVDGLVKEAELAEQYAAGRRAGRLELIQQADKETEKERRTWLAFYRAASKPELTGFDGVVLLERQ